MDEKVKRILEGVLVMFRKYGIRSVSIDDMSKDLCISKKTLYQYFKNKEDILDKCLDMAKEKDATIFSDFKTNSQNAIDSLLDVSKKISQYFTDVNLNFVYDLQKYYPELYKKYSDLNRQHVFNKIKENLERGVKEGIYRDDLSVDLVTLLYIENLDLSIKSQFPIKEKISQEKVFKVVFENHIRGISNPKGIEYFEKRKEFLKFKI